MHPKAMKVIEWPDIRLLKAPKQITDFSNEEFKLNNLIVDMMATAVEYNTTGISANQVGLHLALIVLRLPMKDGSSHPIVMVNPQITVASKETMEFEDGSISTPDYFHKTNRPRSITVRYQDNKGNTVETQFEGIYAFMVHHDIDTMNGNIFAKDLNMLAKSRLKRKLLNKKHR